MPPTKNQEIRRRFYLNVIVIMIVLTSQYNRDSTECNVWIKRSKGKIKRKMKQSWTRQFQGYELQHRWTFCKHSLLSISSLSNTKTQICIWIKIHARNRINRIFKMECECTKHVHSEKFISPAFQMCVFFLSLSKT